MSEDIRWEQRFANYKKATIQLTEFIEKGDLNKFEIQGLIHCFEYTFVLAWKTMKDYLELEGFEVKSPRAAFQMELIADGHVWIDALNKRNLTYGRRSLPSSIGGEMNSALFFPERVLKGVYI